MDSYQPIYDAVRSRISGGNIGDVVERVASQAFDLGHVRAILQQEIVVVSHEHQRPSVLYRPLLSADGDQWCALLGENLQTGVAGFGPTPAAAMAAFDAAFWQQLTPKATRIANAKTPEPADAARKGAPLTPVEVSPGRDQ